MAQPTRRQLLSGVIYGVGALTLSGCASSNEAVPEEPQAEEGPYKLITPGELTCVAAMMFPPFEFMDVENNNEPNGFDIDLSRAISDRLDLVAHWLPSQSFDTLVPAIKAGGTADVAISGMTITDARLAEVDMSDPYIDSNQSIVTRVDSQETSESLNSPSKKIGVQSGTTGEAWAHENLPEAQIVPLDDIISAMNGTTTGSYDGLVIDLPVSMYQISTSFSELKIIEEIPTGEQYGIAVSKNNPALTQAINDALKQIKEDGTLEELQLKWFGDTLQ